jgi:hypothetical protein
MNRIFCDVWGDDVDEIGIISYLFLFTIALIIWPFIIAMGKPQDYDVLPIVCGVLLALFGGFSTLASKMLITLPLWYGVWIGIIFIIRGFVLLNRRIVVKVK